MPLVEKTNESEPTTVHIVPTSHASTESSQAVKQVVDEIQPDVVAVELDRPRLQKLVQQPTEHTVSPRQLLTNTEISRRGRIILYVFALIQSRVSSLLDVDILGRDMLAGYEAANTHDISLALVDRNIKHTFNRLSEQISGVELTKTLGYFLYSYLLLYLPGKGTTDETLNTDEIDVQTLLTSLGEILPTFKRVLVDERNSYITNQVKALCGRQNSIVLVIGAAHEPGVRRLLGDAERVTVKPEPKPETETETGSGSTQLPRSLSGTPPVETYLLH